MTRHLTLTWPFLDLMPRLKFTGNRGATGLLFCTLAGGSAGEGISEMFLASGQTAVTSGETSDKFLSTDGRPGALDGSIVRAEYRASNRELRVEATSSDSSATRAVTN